jgi:two-component system OmpR family sensor kinase
MASSLRRRLQLWYGLVLLGIVLVFGVLLYSRIRSMRMGGIDVELTALADYLDASLRGVPPETLGEPEPAEPDVPVDPEARLFGHHILSPQDIERRLANLDFPETPRRLRSDFSPPEISGREDWFFAIVRRDKTILKSTPNAPTVEELAIVAERPIRRPVFETVNSVRRARMNGPHRSWIVVGKSMRGELAELRQLGLQLFGLGAGVVIVGLAGGWWISGLILSPIRRISEQADAVSEKNLSQRIDVSGIDQELVALASTLNTTFDRLEQAFARQVQLTGDASHELRTPLSVMRTQAELALSKTRTPEEYRDALTGCLEAARRMTKLVDKLLTLARSDAGQLLQKQEVVILNTLVHGVIEELRPLAAARRVTLEAKITPTVVRGDPTNLARVAMNLISNAIYYNVPEGRVDVELKSDKESVVLTVRDTGRGIPVEAQEQLFSRFFRADTSRARASGGHGLGLAITKAVVEAHGGHIDFTSNEKQGTTFRVTLPQCDQPTTEERRTKN